LQAFSRIWVLRIYSCRIFDTVGGLGQIVL